MVSKVEAVLAKVLRAIREAGRCCIASEPEVCHACSIAVHWPETGNCSIHIFPTPEIWVEWAQYYRNESQIYTHSAIREATIRPLYG
jgi:hypothetical protein